MIKIKELQTAGFEPAITAMRHPLQSYDKSDSHDNHEWGYWIGDADKDLSIRLQKAGPEHCKHLRMIMVWAEITAPLYWWKEMDTYRAGVEKLSTSTMHTIAKQPFDITMFSDDHLTVRGSNALQMTIDTLNDYRAAYQTAENEEDKKKYWWQLIQLLPTSFNQKRTVMFSYAALRNIYRQRAGHKLGEWKAFLEWCESLPESWMITE